MSILVTGGAGYIGSHVVYELGDAGYETVILDDLSLGLIQNIDQRAEFVEGSTNNPADLKQIFSDHHIETVIHLAAWKAAGESMENPTKYAHNNMIGTINLLNAALNATVDQIVFSSTAAVYGYPEYLPVDENHRLAPINFYGFTKLFIEDMLKWYSQLKGLRFAALRYFNAAGYDVKGRIKGKEKNPANLIPVVMEVATREREGFEIFGNDYETSDGPGIRDYNHVNDLASAHVLALEYLKNESTNLIVNLATGDGHSVLDVVNTTEKISGKKIPFKVVGRRMGDPAELTAISNLAEDVLGWTTRYSDLKTILQTTWDIYKK
ncbi:MAG: UDP-glucose 4-epimerase GalE [Candidatus Neomarinimicrobiota bacterium]